MQLTNEKKNSLIKNLYYIFINFTNFFSCENNLFNQKFLTKLDKIP